MTYPPFIYILSVNHLLCIFILGNLRSCFLIKEQRMSLATFSRRARLHFCSIYTSRECASCTECFLLNRKVISYSIKKEDHTKCMISLINRYIYITNYRYLLVSFMLRKEIIKSFCNLSSINSMNHASFCK